MPSSRLRAARAITTFATAAICIFPPGHLNAQVRGETKATPVPAPTGVTFRPNSARSVIVSWSPVAAPAKYRLLRSGDSVKTGTEITSGAIGTTTFTDVTLVPGTLYFYSVVAMYADGRVSATAPMRFSLVAPPIPLALPTARLVVTQVAPNPVPVGVAKLLVKGSGFSRLTDVRVGGVHQNWVTGDGGCGSAINPDSVLLITLSSQVAPGPNTLEFTSPIGNTTAPFTLAKASIDAQGVNPPYAKAGEWVTISGWYLAELMKFHNVGCAQYSTDNPSLVTFNGYAATSTTTDGIVIHAQVPTHATGLVSVGTRWFGSADWGSRFVEVPVIATIPASAQAGSSTSITGAAMDAIDSVHLSGGKVAVLGKTYTSISFAVPADIVDRTLSLPVTLFVKIPRGSVPLTGAPVGQDTPMIQVLPLRRITKISPDSGSPGDGITITGVGLTDPPAGSNSNWVPSIWFNGVGSAWTTINTQTTISATIPGDATTGPLTLAQARYAPQITGPVVRVNRAPKFTGSAVYPAGAQVGTPVQIYIQSGSPPTSVSFGGTVVTSGWTVAPGSGMSSLTISMKLPAGAKTGPVVVTTKDGSTTWTSATPFTVYP